MITHHYLKEQLSVQEAPEWIADCIGTAHVIGSHLHGLANEQSDIDVFGFVYPPEDRLFASAASNLPGFDRNFEPFSHYVTKPSPKNPFPVEFEIKSAGVYVYDLMCGRSKPTECLYAPQKYTLRTDYLFTELRNRRDELISQNTVSELLGAAKSAMKQVDRLVRPHALRRAELFDLHGYDTKVAAQMVRLLLQAKQVLQLHTIEFSQNLETLNSIRYGQVDLKSLRGMSHDLYTEINELRATSELRPHASGTMLRELYTNALEEHYGSLTRFGYNVPENDNCTPKF